MYKYVFDLDNTLVFTDELNNEAYNYALKLLGKELICDVNRITREVVFSRYNLTGDEKSLLIDLKQKYFIDNIVKIKENVNLIKFLNEIPSADCILWTSAEKCRVEAILSYLKLNNTFNRICYSTKKYIKDDLAKICQFFQCSKDKLKFYENDSNVISELNLFGISDNNILKV